MEYIYFFETKRQMLLTPEEQQKLMSDTFSEIDRQISSGNIVFLPSNVQFSGYAPRNNG